MSRKRHVTDNASESSSSDSEVEDNPILHNQQELDRPLAGHLRRHRIEPVENSAQCRNIHQFLTASRPILHRLLDDLQNQLRSFKYQLRLKVAFHKAAHPESTAEAYFAHRQSLVLAPGTINESLSESIDEMVTNVETFEQRGSGWVVTSVGFLDIHIARYQPLRASSHIPLPPCLARSKAIINPKNFNDDQCFLYCVLAALHPNTENPERISNWSGKMNLLNTEGLTFPVSIAQLSIFESMNNLSVNLYGFDRREKLLHPLFITQKDLLPETQVHINLLLLTDDALNSHYCWIRNLGRLLHSQTGGKYKKQFCHRCLSAFKTPKSLESHLEYCRTQKTVQRIKMPTGKLASAACSDDDSTPPILKFKQHRKALCQSLIIFGDFECLTEKIKSVQPAPSCSYTRKMEQHTPCGFAIQPIFQCCNKSQFIIESPTVYRGLDAVEEFLNACLKRAELYQDQCDHTSRRIQMQPSD